MCIAPFPQFPQFDLTKEDMDSFYDWFYGPTVAGRRPSPSDQTLLYAERNAWREMHELMHSGLTLKQAMTKVKEDSLFWMREVYEMVIHQHSKGKEKGPGKSKKGKWGPPIRQPYWEKPSGKGKTKDKGKGKGTKSKSSDWPSHWAFKNPKGVPFCRDYQSQEPMPGPVWPLSQLPSDEFPSMGLQSLFHPTELDGVLQQPVALTRSLHSRGSEALVPQKRSTVVDTVPCLQLPCALTEG